MRKGFAVPYVTALAWRMARQPRHGVTALPFHTAGQCHSIRCGNRTKLYSLFQVLCIGKPKKYFFCVWCVRFRGLCDSIQESQKAYRHEKHSPSKHPLPFGRHDLHEASRSSSLGVDLGVRAIKHQQSFENSDGKALHEARSTFGESRRLLANSMSYKKGNACCPLSLRGSEVMKKVRREHLWLTVKRLGRCLIYVILTVSAFFCREKLSYCEKVRRFATDNPVRNILG